MEPTAMLGVSMQALPGVYALMLGSGISSSAGIPTGYAVTVDLIRRIASALNVSCEPDPARWFQERFNQTPAYSSLLAQLAPRPAERAAILRAYFEPTSSERSSGLKVPTEAHRAIARLVGTGHVRVILTTNFDRLLEEALEERGIRPVVISTTGSVRGAPPIQHNLCTVVKLHGDYLDPNIKNTEEELSTYSRPLDKLLDRILDEWGLIVCGWSAMWDIALRRAIERCPNHRYSTYWASRGVPGRIEQRLIDLRRAVPIAIKDADAFFVDLEATVRSLEERTQTGIAHGPTTMTPQAVGREVEHLVDRPQERARLRRLMLGQAEALSAATSDDQFPVSGMAAQSITHGTIAERMTAYERLAANAVAAVATGAYYFDTEEQVDWLCSMISRLADCPLRDGMTVYLNLRRYPALLLLYAGGVSALAARHYETLVRIWLLNVRDYNRDRDVALVSALRPGAVLEGDIARRLPMLPNDRLYTPLSEHLFTILREPLRDAAPLDAEYDRLFDRYEFLAAMINADLSRDDYGPSFHVGRFGWKLRNPGNWQVAAALSDELETDGTNWPPVRAGAFGKDIERARIALKAVREATGRLPWF